MANSQLPAGMQCFNPTTGLMTQPFAFWLNNLSSSLPPGGSGFVVDGSAGTYGVMTIYQGTDASKPSPGLGEIFIAIDTGKIYVENAGVWVLQLPALTGDVTKPLHSIVTTLATVNTDVGTFGSPSDIPIFTVNGKGLITAATSVPLVSPPPSAAGLNTEIQFNNLGVLGASANLTWDGTALTAATNTYPTNQGTAGDVLTTDGAGTASWATPVTGVPYLIATGDTYLVPLYYQVLFSFPITIDGTLTVDGKLIEVD